MTRSETYWDRVLGELEAEDNLRVLSNLAVEGKYIYKDGKRFLNLSSNDYLGLLESDLQGGFWDEAESFGQGAAMGMGDGRGRSGLSNPSSRLVTGNSLEYGRLEASLAELYPGRVATVLGSGYLANAGVLGALTSGEDVVLADKLVHASLIDGLKLCKCEWGRFRHNDMEHLEMLLRRHAGRNIWVATESVFSMDGDLAPLAELVGLKQRYGFSLYLDEAHAFGVRGEKGAGLASELGLDGQVDVLVGTLGKAACSYGAFVITSELGRRMLINKMRTLIFATALPPISLAWSDFVVRRMGEFSARRERLGELVGLMGAQSHIAPVVTGENAAAVKLALRLQDAGFWVMPIRYPTVPKGKARVRVSLTAALTAAEIEEFKRVCKAVGL